MNWLRCRVQFMHNLIYVAQDKISRRGFIGAILYVIEKVSHF
jgi:hypothetical protein